MIQSKKSLVIALVVAVPMILTACAPVEVQRVDPNQEIALTDRWNAKDSELVATAMIEDMLSFPWIAKHNTRYQQRPTVVIQRVGNESHEEIEVATFINDLKRSLIRSGEVDFVALTQERRMVRKERAENEVHRRAGTGAASGQETGANYALSGVINSFVDSSGGKRVTSYQIDLKLIDMETNLEVWNGQKKIQKLQTKNKFLGIL